MGLANAIISHQSVQLTHWINWGGRNWKKLSDPQIEALEAAYNALSKRERFRVNFFRFVRTMTVEILYQGPAQLAMHTFLHQHGVFIPLTPFVTRSFWKSIGLGSVGEYGFDLSTEAYRVWALKRGTVAVLADANMAFMTLICSLMSTSGILLSSGDAKVGWIMVGVLNGVGWSSLGFFKGVYHSEHPTMKWIFEKSNQFDDLMGAWVGRFVKFTSSILQTCESLLGGNRNKEE